MTRTLSKYIVYMHPLTRARVAIMAGRTQKHPDKMKVGALQKKGSQKSEIVDTTMLLPHSSCSSQL
jgi:hypothetical protein